MDTGTMKVISPKGKTMTDEQWELIDALKCKWINALVDMRSEGIYQVNGLAAFPHCNASERMALGSMLIDNEAVNEVVAILGSLERQQEIFYKVDHEVIYGAMLDLHKRHEPVDQVTVSEELSRDGLLRAVGGAAYIAGLASALTTSYYAGKAAQMVYKMHVQRRLLKASIDAVENYLMCCHEDLDEVNKKTEKAFNSVLQEYAEHKAQSLLEAARLYKKCV
jgi:replicative DNA helicase